MVDAAVSFTIEKLSEFVTQHVNIRIGVKDGIEWLRDELGYLLISVRAVESQQNVPHVRLWTDSVRDVSDQAVIILDRFSAQQEEHGAPEHGSVLDRMQSFFCICKKEANLYDIGKDIESLKEKIIRIKSRRDEFRITDIITATPPVQQRKRTLLRAASFDYKDDVIGFKKDIQTLLDQLGNQDPALGLISIHGMGGLGKSTLASKLYHSSELSHFKSRAWVCVSEDYDITHVLRKIIKCFQKDEQDLLNKMEEVELLRHLREILLDGDHYFAVIDDIWDIQVWKKIKNAFPDKKNGSRIIITTRNKLVAEGVEDTCFVHELSFLSKDESWELFWKRAKPTSNLQMLGKEMVEKCGDLPLAIVILSGLLLQKKTYQFWSDVKDQLWRKLKGESSEIQEILNLSYEKKKKKLSEFVTQHVNIRIGVKDGIEWLRDELGYLLISVRAVESQQNLPQVRLWTDSVRDVSDEAEIILDRFSAQQEEHAAPEHDTVLDRMQSFFCICKKEANLYDIGKDIESIHGMGGLGKSTLASKLYHSIQLSHFRRRAWVCVSEDYDIKSVLRKIIKCFEGDAQDLLNKMEEVELLRHLRKILLDGDHYLAVIDDIWQVDVWKKIKNAFPDKKNGSRVIITTRNKLVAEGVEDTCFIHELSFLSKDESWQLFCKRAKPTPNLEMLGKEMVAKCGGLPLAIVILSGLLLQKSTFKYWSAVKDQIWRKLKGESSEIQDLLNLSYDDLSFYIRQCFLYLARYPEDHIIQVSKLKLLWIAEDIVEKRDGEDMEDVAEDYVNELINRNMIQIELQTVDGQVLVCKIHDLVRDLVVEKARLQKILGIFYPSKQHPDPIHLLQGQARHAIYNGTGEYLKLLGPNSDNLNLRSLAVTNEIDSIKVEEVKLMYTRFQYLKVLDLTSTVDYSEGISEAIGDLVLLKFLGLMTGDLVIPPSTGKLKRLQTLHGSDNYLATYVFPKEICELKELRHIIFHANTGNLNLGSDQTELQTISGIIYKEWCHIDTNNWTNLHTLVISAEEDGDNDEEYSLESIANLTSLRTLIFQLYGVISTMQPLSSCKHLNKVMMLGCRIKDVAELRFLPGSITDLSLPFIISTEDPMPILGSLSNLASLCLDDCGNKMVFGSDAFPYLQFLEINTMDGGLFELEVDDGALPSLRAFTTYPMKRIGNIALRISSLPLVPDFSGQLW